MVQALKRAVGKDSEEVKAAETLKRALMMLPLLPEGLIEESVVDIIVARWDTAFPERRGHFNELRTHLVHNYVADDAGSPSGTGV